MVGPGHALASVTASLKPQSGAGLWHNAFGTCVPVAGAGTRLLARRQSPGIPEQVLIDSSLGKRLAE